MRNVETMACGAVAVVVARISMKYQVLVLVHGHREALDTVAPGHVDNVPHVGKLRHFLPDGGKKTISPRGAGSGEQRVNGVFTCSSEAPPDAILLFVTGSHKSQCSRPDTECSCKCF